MANNRKMRQWMNQYGQYTVCLAFILVMSLVFSCIAIGDNIITSGCTVKVSSGTVVSSSDNLIMNSGSELNVQGTLVLKKNLVNLNTSPASLGTGTMEFSGTSNQTISGQCIIQNMTVNNSTGLSVSGNTRVNGTLTLTSGLVTLGSNNLSLGPASAISGTPSESNMIVPAGTGQLQKEFPVGFTGSFIFPVGDTTVTYEYSPVELNFASGSFASGNYAGITLVNAKYPDANITTSYLKRYWKITQSGITGFTCTANFKYVDADIVGTESALFCLKVDPSPYITYDAGTPSSNLLTATELNSFSTFTGAMGCHELSLTAFLEGPYNSGVMNTTLRDNNLLPTGQPYSGSPWNYAGEESVGSFPSGVVDWVLIELRQADLPANATPSTIIKKRAAFIKSNGSIVDLDGSSPVRFYNSNINNTLNLYPVIRQRNHLAIMSSSGVNKNSGIYTYNFSDAGSKTYGYPNGIKQVGSSWCMVGGNGSPDADINTDDISFSWNLQFGNYGYYSGDFSLNGSVDTDDISFIWNPNFGLSGGITNKNIQGYHSMVP